MKWLGHYEFGANFKPINFAGWLENRDRSIPVDETFWLEYWIAAYSYALGLGVANVRLVNFDQLLAEPVSSLEKIAATIELDGYDSLTKGAAKLRSPTSRAMEPNRVSPDVWERAHKLYAELVAAAL